MSDRTKYISQICDLVKTAGSMDLRIGQLFVTLISDLDRDGKDLFYIENEELYNRLYSLINKGD